MRDSWHFLLSWLSKAPGVVLAQPYGRTQPPMAGVATLTQAVSVPGVSVCLKMLFQGVSLCVAILCVVCYKLLLCLLIAALRRINSCMSCT